MYPLRMVRQVGAVTCDRVQQTVLGLSGTVMAYVFESVFGNGVARHGSVGVIVHVGCFFNTDRTVVPCFGRFSKKRVKL